MIKKDITSKDSIKENLEEWCYEVGSRFESASIDAANDFADKWAKLNLEKGPFKYMNLSLPLDVVDLGSGDGAATEELYHLGFCPIAVDINKEKLDKIKEHLSPIRKIYTDMEDYLYSQEDNSIDNIFSHHSLEHTVDAEEVIKLCGEKLKPGGLYYVVVPAGDYLHSVHHVVFQTSMELLPKGLKFLYVGCRERFGEKEFFCVATK